MPELPRLDVRSRRQDRRDHLCSGQDPRRRSSPGGNGAGDGDRTHDIQLGNRLTPKALECRERGRIGRLVTDLRSVPRQAEPCNTARKIAISVLPAGALM